MVVKSGAIEQLGFLSAHANVIKYSQTRVDVDSTACIFWANTEVKLRAHVKKAHMKAGVRNSSKICGEILYGK